MTSRRNILIVGGDSTVGRALAAAHRECGDQVFVTSRRSRLGSNTWPLDLAEASSNWRPPVTVDAAYLCGAITSLNSCEENPIETAHVNVTGTLTVAEALLKHGAFLTFLSSNLVFDGSHAHMQADAKPTPRCEYGRQKATVEKKLGHSANVAIVRLTKVISPDHALFTSWLGNLSRGEPINPFADMVMAPVALALACKTLLAVTERRRGGITHVSASEDITYAEAARYLARRAGANLALVHPISASTLRPVPFAPAHTSLAPSEPITTTASSISPFAALDLFASARLVTALS